MGDKVKNVELVGIEPTRAGTETERLANLLTPQVREPNGRFPLHP
jgi:hypothetical protein